MNLKRKLKLHSLNIYNFSQNEQECIDLIQSLYVKKLTFEQLNFYYFSINLNIEYTQNKDLYFKDKNGKYYYDFNVRRGRLLIYGNLTRYLTKSFDFREGINFLKILISKKYNINVKSIEYFS